MLMSLGFCGMLDADEFVEFGLLAFRGFPMKRAGLPRGRLALLPLTSSPVSGRDLMMRAIRDFFSKSPKTGQSSRRREKLRASLTSMISTRSMSSVLSSPSRLCRREVLRGPSDRWSFSNRLRIEAPTSALKTSADAPLRSRQTQISASEPRARRAMAERRWVTSAGSSPRSRQDAGDFRHAAGADTVENPDDFLHPHVAEGIGKGFVNRTLAAGWKRAGFLGEFHGIGGKQEVGKPDGGGIEFEGFGRTDDFIAGGDELQGLAELDAGGFFRAFVDVAEQALEGVGVVFEGADIGGDGLEGPDHALDVAGGLEIRDQGLGRDCDRRCGGRWPRCASAAPRPGGFRGGLSWWHPTIF